MNKWRTVIALLTVSMITIASGCDGFFVDPSLTGVAVGPAATIQTGTTIQMAAVGTYNDGSQKKLSSNVFWNSATPKVATIDGKGIVTGVGPGQAVISAAVDTVSGSATVTVIIGSLTSIKVTSQDGFNNITYGSSEQFVATGTSDGQQFNVTDTVTWSTNPQSIPNVSIDSKSGLLTTTSSSAPLVQFDVIATDPTTGISGDMNFTVH